MVSKVECLLLDKKDVDKWVRGRILEWWQRGEDEVGINGSGRYFWRYF